MENYRDHPNAFLQSRPSVEGIRHRASDWRKKGFEADGVDVAGLLDRCGTVLMLARQRFEMVLDLIRSEEPLDVIVEFCSHVAIDHELINLAWVAGQSLRENGSDPYGGSVASTLEMASDEFVHLAYCVESVIQLVQTTESYDAIEAVVLDALDYPVNADRATPTHEAPRMLM
jgi:hypothetical protein